MLVNWSASCQLGFITWLRLLEYLSLFHLSWKAPMGSGQLGRHFLHTYIPSRGSRSLHSWLLPACYRNWPGITSRMMGHLACMQTWPFPTLRKEFGLSKKLVTLDEWVNLAIKKNWVCVKGKHTPKVQWKKYDARWHIDGMLDSECIFFWGGGGWEANIKFSQKK